MAQIIEAQPHPLVTLRLAGTKPDGLLDEVLRGLAKPRKELPCKLFYDERGSALFEQICTLQEYYLTRAETAILAENAEAIAGWIEPRCLLIEFGSGSSTKTRILLDHLREPAAYIPIDLSEEQLLRSAEAIARAYPRLEVIPLIADYTQRLALPGIVRAIDHRVGFFPGSTIGNFYSQEATAFLRRVKQAIGPGGGLLIGVDLKKDPRLLHLAYNDAAGVTADFNRNILAHINWRFGANFQPDLFAHRARYNSRLGRIEMFLISQADQVVQLDSVEFAFREGESILTEVSYKYDLDQFRALAGEAGLEVRQVWTDDRQLFSVQFLRARREGKV